MDDDLLNCYVQVIDYGGDEIVRYGAFRYGLIQLHLNSRGLELSEITRTTPDPSGGVIQRDSANGEPNGVLEESAQQVIRDGGRGTMSQDDLLAAIAWSSRDYVEEGVTTAVVTGSFGANVEVLESAADHELLQLRIIAYEFSGNGDTSVSQPT